jgi:NAD-dependent DNA ligase
MKADMFILAKHADLIKKLRELEVAYHTFDAPLVDDATYDAIKIKALD